MRTLKELYDQIDFILTDHEKESISHNKTFNLLFDLTINFAREACGEQYKFIVEIKDILECIAKFDNTESLEIKGSYFDCIQRDVKKLLTKLPEGL